MHQRDARLPRRRRHPVAVFRGQGQRLFAENMFSGLRGGNCHLRVQVVRQAQIYRLDLRIG